LAFNINQVTASTERVLRLPTLYTDLIKIGFSIKKNWNMTALSLIQLGLLQNYAIVV